MSCRLNSAVISNLDDFISFWQGLPFCLLCLNLKYLPLRNDSNITMYK